MRHVIRVIVVVQLVKAFVARVARGWGASVMHDGAAEIGHGLDTALCVVEVLQVRPGGVVTVGGDDSRYI